MKLEISTKFILLSSQRQINFMDLKKAFVSSVILYSLIFLIASGLMFVISDETVFGSITLLLAAVFTFLLSREYYFKGMKIANPVKEGLLLGIVLIVVMVAIDIPVMVYGFAAETGWSYFTTWHILLGYLMALIIPVFVAYRMK